MHLVLSPENPCQSVSASASVLVRVCPTKPTRCYLGAFGFKPRESVSNLGPQGQISCFKSYKTQSSRVRRSSPRPRPNYREVPVCWSGSALHRLLGVTPVHLVLSPENPCQTWDSRAKFRVLYHIEIKVRGSAVRAPDLGPTSGKCQCAGQGVPYNAY